MSYKQAKIDIQKAFYTGWTAAGYSADIIAWVNEKFTKPSNSTWVRVSIFPGSASRIELGPGDAKLHVGLVDVEIFVPSDQKGTNDIYTYIDVIAAIFVNQNIEDNHFDGYDLFGPSMIEEGWIKANISFPFKRYE